MDNNQQKTNIIGHAASAPQQSDSSEDGNGLAAATNGGALLHARTVMNPSLHINAAASKKMEDKNDKGKDGAASINNPKQLIADLKTNLSSFKSECLSENSASPEDVKSSQASPDREVKAAS